MTNRQGNAAMDTVHHTHAKSTTHEGNTVTLPAGVVSRARSHGLEFSNRTRTDGRNTHELRDRMTGKLLGRSRTFKKLADHATRIMSKMPGTGR